MDLKSLSLEELTALEKSIKAEKHAREVATKEALSSIALFFHSFDPDEHSEAALEMANKMDGAILEICDFTLGNYDIKTFFRKNQAEKKRALRGGSHIHKVDFNTYKAMVEELRDVIMKYIVPIKKEEAE